MYIDDHAHILPQYFSTEEIKALVEDAIATNVKYIINNGLNPTTNREILKLSEQYPILKVALGGYPIDMLKLNIDDELNFITKNKNKIIAIGEVGLDFKHPTDKNLQISNFRKFIKLSEQINKPLIVHSRNAEKEVIELLEKSNNPKFIIHTFTGNFKLAKKIEENNWMFSIPTSICYSMHFQELVKRINISKILTETDSPLMHPQKKEKNTPANIVHSVKIISKLKNLDIQETKNIIFMNFQKTFL